MKLKIDIHVWIVNASDVETASSTASMMSTLWDLGFIPFYPFKIPKLPLSKLKLTQQPWQESNSAATFSKGKKNILINRKPNKKIPVLPFVYDITMNPIVLTRIKISSMKNKKPFHKFVNHGPITKKTFDQAAPASQTKEIRRKKISKKRLLR